MKTEIVTAVEAAERFGVSRQRVHTWILERRLKARRSGKTWLVILPTENGEAVRPKARRAGRPNGEGK